MIGFSLDKVLIRATRWSSPPDSSLHFRSMREKIFKKIVHDFEHLLKFYLFLTLDSALQINEEKDYHFETW